MGSTSIFEIMNLLEEKGFSVWLDEEKLKYKAPRENITEENLNLLKEHKFEIISLLKKRKEGDLIVIDRTNRYEPFPLTDVQTAYLMGRRELFEYGGLACHVYLELRYKSLDAKKVEEVWNKLIIAHDMLRSIVHEGGYQQVLEEVPRFKVPHWRIRNENKCDEYEAFRHEMGHKVYPLGQWPMFGVAVTEKENDAILHFSMDFLIADWTSIWKLLSEFESLYYGIKQEIKAPDITFRDYLLIEKRMKESEQYIKDKSYWQKRIKNFSDMPELPILSSESVKNNFYRKMLLLTPHKWERIKIKAQRYGITPTVVILTAYADVIRRWSRNKKFCINLTVLNRLPLHEEVQDIVGDFTTLDLLEIDTEKNDTFLERANKIASTLFEDLDHQLFTGVEVIRELSKVKNQRVFMPIVYTSAIGLSEKSRQLKGEFYDGITQTPQVFIDCQAMDGNFGLQINWDIREGIFPDGIIEDMFAAFTDRIYELAEEDFNWREINTIPLPRWQKKKREETNDTQQNLPVHLLHSEFRKRVKECGERIAVVDKDGEISYKELDSLALKIKTKLQREGVQPQDCVAIMLEKSRFQVAAVLGALYAGAIYVPLLVGQAPGRIEKILKTTNTKVILTSSIDRDDSIKGKKFINVDRITKGDSETPDVYESSVDDVAYVIFTSGSTGEPKGVAITHRGAVNTIESIIRLINLSEKDTVLGLSKLNFDLSVFDDFGLLSVGGKIVYPSPENYMNPIHWEELIEKYGITIWNSVPPLMKLYLPALEKDDAVKKGTIRVALLSGEWLPKDMPGEVEKNNRDVTVINLGGATEASIWSIYHECIKGMRYEKIPYGKPLPNQQFDILDSHFESCPVGVIGEIVIKGIGLAAGYYGDEELTRKKFVIDQKSGKRMYLTGDLGRYMSGGEIELIGRNDNQVKIRGHRIELGEIESVLKAEKSVKDAVTIMDRDKTEILSMIEFAQISSDEQARRHEKSLQVRTDIEKFAGTIEESLNWEQVRQAFEARNCASVYSLLYALQQLGLLQKNEIVGIKEFMNNSAISEKYRWLVMPWIESLQKYQLLDKLEESKIVARESVTEEIKEDKWNTAFKVWKDSLGTIDLLRYVKENADRLVEILTDKVDPISILYPDGSNKYTKALYVQNTVTKHINGMICALLIRIQNQLQGRKLRILEVGAGTGATTEWILKALEGTEFEYYFTDISKYFFPEAQKRFGKYENVTIKKLDLNKDFIEQGFRPNSFDVVIGAYVLNNVTDIKETVIKLEELISPNGYLVFSETTSAEAWLLISQALMMTRPNDFLRRDKVFISPEQWIEVLNESDNRENAYMFPEKESSSAILGAGLFVKQFKQEFEYVTETDLRCDIKVNLPDYMIPTEICAVKQIPLSSNGKIDRKAVLEWFQRYGHEEEESSKQEPGTELEKEICRLWCEALEIEDIGKKENFYDYGADSLVMAQVTTKVREVLHIDIPFDALLRQMLNTPTAEEVAKYISEYGIQKYENTKCEVAFENILKMGNKKESRGRILLHGALGSVEMYRYLVPELVKQDVGEIITIGISDMRKYCALEAEEVIPFLADLYTQKILEEDIQKVQIIGYSFSGGLAVEIAKRLLEEGIDVEDVAIVDGGSIPINVVDEIIYELFFVGNIHVSLEKLGFCDTNVFEEIFKTIIINEQDNISIEDFAGAGIDTQVYRRLKELEGMEQDERFKLYLKFSADSGLHNADMEVLKRLYTIFKQSFKALHFVPSVYFGDIRYFKTKERSGIFKYFESLLQEWDDICIGEFMVTEIDGNHYTCLENEKFTLSLADKLGEIYFR